MLLDLSRLTVRRLAHELERWDTLAAFVNNNVERELDELRDMAGDEDEGIEFYADEAYDFSDVSTRFTQLAAVGLYSIVEVHTVALLTFRVSPRKPRGLHRIQKVKRSISGSCWRRSECS